MPSPILALIREQESDLRCFLGIAPEGTPKHDRDSAIVKIHLASIRAIIKAVREREKDTPAPPEKEVLTMIGWNAAKSETIAMLRELEEGIKE